MDFGTQVIFVRLWLVIFNVILGLYCITIGMLVLQRPCVRACEARQMTSLETVVLDFHFIFAVAMLVGSAGTYANHSKLVQFNRFMFVLFSVSNVTFGVWELLKIQEYPVIGTLTLLVGVLVFVFGGCPSWHYRQLLKRQLALSPEQSFHNIRGSSQPPRQSRSVWILSGTVGADAGRSPLQGVRTVW
ncbi:hypothetical protein FI667_g517, partial [Globisporangium splendens]